MASMLRLEQRGQPSLSSIRPTCHTETSRVSCTDMGSGEACATRIGRRDHKHLRKHTMHAAGGSSSMLRLEQRGQPSLSSIRPTCHTETSRVSCTDMGSGEACATRIGRRDHKHLRKHTMHAAGGSRQKRVCKELAFHAQCVQGACVSRAKAMLRRPTPTKASQTHADAYHAQCVGYGHGRLTTTA